MTCANLGEVDKPKRLKLKDSFSISEMDIKDTASLNQMTLQDFKMTSVEPLKVFLSLRKKPHDYEALVYR